MYFFDILNRICWVGIDKTFQTREPTCPTRSATNAHPQLCHRNSTASCLRTHLCRKSRLKWSRLFSWRTVNQVWWTVLGLPTMRSTQYNAYSLSLSISLSLHPVTQMWRICFVLWCCFWDLVLLLGLQLWCASCFLVRFVFLGETQKRHRQLTQVYIHTWTHTLRCCIHKGCVVRVGSDGPVFRGCFKGSLHVIHTHTTDPCATSQLRSPHLSTCFSHFLQDEADAILMDLWFGAFEVPVDEVRSYTWDDLHPPLPPLPIDPFFPTWVWGLITSASSAIVMLIPLYCCPLGAIQRNQLLFLQRSSALAIRWPFLTSFPCHHMPSMSSPGYFRRLSSTRRKYRPPAGVDPSFMEKVVAQSDARVVRRFVAQDAGAQLLRDADWRSDGEALVKIRDLRPPAMLEEWQEMKMEIWWYMIDRWRRCDGNGTPCWIVFQIAPMLHAQDPWHRRQGLIGWTSHWHPDVQQWRWSGYQYEAPLSWMIPGWSWGDPPLITFVSSRRFDQKVGKKSSLVYTRRSESLKIHDSACSGLVFLAHGWHSTCLMYILFKYV